MTLPLFSILLCLIIMVSMTNGAFLSKPFVERSSTLYLFGSGSKKEDAKNPEVKIQKDEKKPFIFLYGRPQYDWVTGKVMSDNSWVSKKRVDWAPNYTSYKKNQDEDTKKNGKK